ncbi:NfeD family protein [Alkalibacterium sp. MB6]|uniref:NfeD family protein n=1 Tax=Alkalibacterium sp. MB6 TaxID=2081965 RepID=UPI001379DA26|nr:NfeD family protein [Alkalibacterium sp. MB6]
MEGLLLGLGFIGIAIAILTPSMKSGTALTILSLSGYFFFVGIANWLPILLFTAGLLLIIMEVFIPDFGLVGILGIVLLVAGLYLTHGDMTQAIQDLSLSVVITAGVVIYLLRKGYSLANVNKLILTTNVPGKTTQEKVEKAPLEVGMTGEAESPLRPSGKAVFADDTHAYDVLSVDGHISKGTPVIVDAVRGTKITVRKIK